MQGHVQTCASTAFHGRPLFCSPGLSTTLPSVKLENMSKSCRSSQQRRCVRLDFCASDSCAEQVEFGGSYGCRPPGSLNAARMSSKSLIRPPTHSYRQSPFFQANPIWGFGISKFLDDYETRAYQNEKLRCADLQPGSINLDFGVSSKTSCADTTSRSENPTVPKPKPLPNAGGFVGELSLH